MIFQSMTIICHDKSDILNFHKYLITKNDIK